MCLFWPCSLVSCGWMDLMWHVIGRTNCTDVGDPIFTETLKNYVFSLLSEDHFFKKLFNIWGDWVADKTQVCRTLVGLLVVFWNYIGHRTGSYFLIANTLLIRSVSESLQCSSWKKVMTTGMSPWFQSIAGNPINVLHSWFLHAVQINKILIEFSNISSTPFQQLTQETL